MSSNPTPKDINLSYSKKVVEQARVEDLLEILKCLKTSELKSISRLVDIRLGKPKFISKQLVELCLNQVKKFDSFVEYEMFAHSLSLELFIFCESRLQDSYANPSREQIHELIPVLIDKFGALRTQFLFAVCIDGEQNVSEIAKDLFNTNGELAFVSLEKPSDLPTTIPPQRFASTEIKQSRKAKKLIQREERARMREQREKSKEALREINERRRILRKIKRNTIEIMDPANADGSADSNLQIVKRQHPHISRFQDADRTGKDVGKIGMAFIWFTGPTRGGGKTRPVVIIARTKKHYIVRPIYSKARRPAGSWRAVVINEWQTANLSNPSVVGDETHKVKFDKLRIIGELTLQDWNRVCLGEVNSQS